MNGYPHSRSRSPKRSASRGWCIFVVLLMFISVLLFTYQLRQPDAEEDLQPSPKQQTSADLDIHPSFELLFPVQHPEHDNVWQDLNAQAMRSLFMCMAARSCGENQTSVVLLASYHFSNAIEGHVSGEDIWAMSIQNSLRQMGYTFLYARDMKTAGEQYRVFPDLVKVVISEAVDIDACFNDKNCVKSERNRLGIPAWKMFSFHYWGTVANPLGAPWTLSPEDYRNGNQYLGYSVEEVCTTREMIAPADRDAQVYVFGKRLSYFYHHDYAWSNDIFGRLRTELDLRLAAGINNDTQFESSFPNHLDNYGQLSKQKFYELLAHSHALVGLGVPPLSPSPYDALCLGVPFVNPVIRWDERKPMDRAAWITQHEGVKYLDPPYVYHVFKSDADGLLDAVRAAIANPIPRFIPPAMRMGALNQRVAHLVENDWQSLADELLENRVMTSTGLLFEI